MKPLYIYKPYIYSTSTLFYLPYVYIIFTTSTFILYPVYISTAILYLPLSHFLPYTYPTKSYIYLISTFTHFYLISTFTLLVPYICPNLPLPCRFYETCICFATLYIPLLYILVSYIYYFTSTSTLHLLLPYT